MMNRASRLDEIEKLCRSYEGLAAIACWGELSRAAADKHNYNLTAVLAFCNSSPTKETAKECKVHMVSLMALRHNFNITSVKYICTAQQEIYKNFEGYCYTTLVGAALSILRTQKGSQTVEFCSAIPEEYRRICFKHIADTLLSYHNPAIQMQEICKEAPPEYVSVCSGITGNDTNSLKNN